MHHNNLPSTYLFHIKYRVFAAVIITARSVTTALSRASETSEAYESGRKVFALIKDSKEPSIQLSGSKRMVGKHIAILCSICLRMHDKAGREISI